MIYSERIILLLTRLCFRNIKLELVTFKKSSHDKNNNIKDS